MTLKHFNVDLIGSDRVAVDFFKFDGPVVRFHMKGISENNLDRMSYSSCVVDIPLWGYDDATWQTRNSIRLLMEKVGLGQINEVIKLLKFRRDHEKWTRGGFLYKWLFDEPVYTGTLPLDYEPTAIELEIAAAARKKSNWVNKDVCALWHHGHTFFRGTFFSLVKAHERLRERERADRMQDAQWSSPY